MKKFIQLFLISSIAIIHPAAAQAAPVDEDGICKRTINKKKIGEDHKKMRESARVFSALTLKALADLAISGEKLSHEGISRAIVYLFVHQIEFVEKNFPHKCKITKKQCQARTQKLGPILGAVASEIGAAIHQGLVKLPKDKFIKSLAEAHAPLTDVVFNIMKWSYEHPTSVNGCQ